MITPQPTDSLPGSVTGLKGMRFWPHYQPAKSCCPKSPLSVNFLIIWLDLKAHVLLFSITRVAKTCPTVDQGISSSTGGRTVVTGHPLQLVFLLGQSWGLLISQLSKGQRSSWLNYCGHTHSFHDHSTT